MRPLLAGALAAMLWCRCAAAAPKQREPGSREAFGRQYACNLEPAADCGAGQLPRLTERSWPKGESKTLLARAAAGTVAVVWDGKQASLVEGCRLDGGYTEVAGEGGAGRFWASNRVFFRVDEISAACRPATHLVAAFATAPDPARAAPPGGSADAAAAGAFGAILVALPCPSVTDADRAVGCIGRGLTGPERLARGRAMSAGFHTDEGLKEDVSRLIEIFALMPDDYRGLLFLQYANTKDCALRAQGEWLLGQYATVKDADGNRSTRPRGKEAPAMPRLGLGTWQSCINRPVFLSCFPGLFNPAPAGAECWSPAAPRGGRP
jgi:hypothetical protein